MLGAAVASAPSVLPGFFGKIVSFADFVSRRLPRSFIEPWDEWLQHSLLSSRERLGAVWHDTYMTSPIWRFLLSSAVCGPGTWAGVLMPSIDRVGRHFPFTLAAEVPELQGRLAFLTETAWFEELEQLALSTLDEPFDLEVLDASLQRLRPPVPVNGVTSRRRAKHSNAVSWCFGLASAATVSQGLPVLAESLAEGALDQRTFWWTSGSDKVTPCLLSFRGLPTADNYADLLDGNWARSGWINCI
jgi:type VI secretion system protein ImpM